MNITQQTSAGTLTLILDGELDANSSHVLDEVLNNSELLGYDKILLDCADLAYISSAGLGVVISHIKRLQDAKVKMVFFNMKDKVSNVFEILGLNSLLTIVPTAEEAATV